jgi:hypothetical protein
MFENKFKCLFLEIKDKESCFEILKILLNLQRLVLPQSFKHYSDFPKRIAN